MARPKSENKRIALLEAATIAVAELGLGAAASLIAKNAGVAEGTLFRYFATKDELLNALYIHLKKSLSKTMMENYHRDALVKERACAVWSSFIDWGLLYPSGSSAMRQLSVSGKITDETIYQADHLYPELYEIVESSMANEVFSCGQPAFVDAIFFSLAETTMAFASREPEKADSYKTAGFEVMWRAMTKG